VAAYCNNSRLIREGEEYKIIGDPTEAALLVMAEKRGMKEISSSRELERVDDLPFSPEFRYRASLVAEGEKRYIYMVGAPEAVLNRSTLIEERGETERITTQERQDITLYAQVEEIAKKGMRVLALAYKEVPREKVLTREEINEMVFLGLAGLIDPPRENVKEAIASAREAGIRVVMATGDHRETALAIAREIGIVDEEGIHPRVVTEQELLDLSEEEFRDTVENVPVFSRLSPTTKLKIAQTLQEEGHIVAMTGDGVNDAPALKKADIGVAMGVIGTDVARESSEVVLADDNFASIINAVEEGRIVFRNTKQASFFLVTTNFAEDITIISSLFLGFHLPLLPTQILYLNLVTDGVSDVAIAAEPSHGDVMHNPPLKPQENILSGEAMPFLALMVLIMAASTLAVFYSFLPHLEKARTAAFCTMAFTQLFNVLNMRSLRRSVFHIGLFSNRYILISLVASLVLMGVVLYLPFFQEVFHFSYLSPGELLAILALSSLVLWLGELYKRSIGRKLRKRIK